MHNLIVGSAFVRVFRPEDFLEMPFAWLPAPKRVEYGIDGWPVGMPPRWKRRMPESVKLLFQLEPCEWHLWDDDYWRDLPVIAPMLVASALERRIRFTDEF